MNIRDKIFIYNILTSVFAVFAFICFCGISGDGSIATIALYGGFFGMLAYNCAKKENELRCILKKKLRAKRRKNAIAFKNSATQKVA